MHVLRPLLDLRHFIFVLQYNFKMPLTLTLMINRSLQSINIVLICFLKRLCAKASNNNDRVLITQTADFA